MLEVNCCVKAQSVLDDQPRFIGGDTEVDGVFHQGGQGRHHTCSNRRAQIQQCDREITVARRGDHFDSTGHKLGVARQIVVGGGDGNALAHLGSAHQKGIATDAQVDSIRLPAIGDSSWNPICVRYGSREYLPLSANATYKHCARLVARRSDGRRFTDQSNHTRVTKAPKPITKFCKLDAGQSIGTFCDSACDLGRNGVSATGAVERNIEICFVAGINGGIAAYASIHDVVPGVALHLVGAAAAIDNVIPGTCHHDIVAEAGINSVIATLQIEIFVLRRTSQDIVTRSAGGRCGNYS